MADDDRTLVRRHLQGDPDAFNELARRHEQRVYNLAYRMVGRAEDARDAAQDAWLAVFRRLSTYRGEAAFTTWLHRIVVNACHNILRHRGREPQPMEIEDSPDVASDPAEQSSAGVDVHRALQQVPEEYRVALILCDLQDLSYDQAAEILEVPVGTVKSRLHRGRVALARAFRGTPRPAPASEEVSDP